MSEDFELEVQFCLLGETSLDETARPIPTPTPPPPSYNPESSMAVAGHSVPDKSDDRPLLFDLIPNQKRETVVRREFGLKFTEINVKATVKISVLLTLTASYLSQAPSKTTVVFQGEGQRLSIKSSNLTKDAEPITKILKQMSSKPITVYVEER